ncbi:MAG: hypothetical protein ACI4RJ_01315 [Alphaproteobacteria bacterium]
MAVLTGRLLAHILYEQGRPHRRLFLYKITAEIGLKQFFITGD